MIKIQAFEDREPRCPECGSKDVTIENANRVTWLVCNSCGFDGNEEYGGRHGS